jgi:hypothetical protein
MLKVLGIAGARVVAVVMMLGLSASPALATDGHSFSGFFGTAGSGAPGGFTYPGPGGVAVRQSTGDVYVADPFNLDSVSSAAAPRVERFDAAGVFQSEFAIDAGTYSAPGAVAVGPSSGGDVVYVGAVQTAGAVGAVLRYSTAGVAGVPLSSAGSGSAFANPVAVAADPVDGTVYVSAVDSTSSSSVIDKFSSAGVFQAKFDGSSGAPGGVALTAVSGLAVDGAHRLYVSDGQKVYRYSAAGAYQLTVEDAGARGLPVQGFGVDAASNEVYVNEPDSIYTGQIRVFDTAGVQSQPPFATPTYSAVAALAVVAGTGTVYGSDIGDGLGQRFVVFTGPTVVTGAGTPIDSASETLNGTINPEGVSGTTYHFEYGADANYGNSTPDVDPGSGSSAVAASDTANVGLLPSSTYHFRLVGTNPGGTIYGADNTFTTAPGPPVVDGSPPSVSAITPTGATLNGTIDPRGSITSYHFDYGLDTSYGSVSTPNGSIAAGQGNQGASSPVTGLQPGTTYHFRIVADNGTGGPQAGADQTFITGPAAAASATDITAVKATLTGVVNSHGGSARYHFEYSGAGETLTTDDVDASPVDADTPVTATSGPLRPGTVYTVRTVLVVTDPNTNASITTTGAEGTFTTDPAPLAATAAVTGVTPSAATFSGSYDTNGRAGSYQFVIGSSTSPYLAQTDPVAVSGSGTASGALNNLPAGQTYHVRLAVTSDGATVLGDAVTFITPAQPAVVPPAPVTTATATGPYGCTAPVLGAYNAHPKAGEAITISGSDLGVGGNATLGTNPVATSAWSASGFTITVPDDAIGSLPLTVNCGTVSNTIAIQIYKAPSNTFTATAKASKTASTVTVASKVPGPGAISVSGSNLKTTTKHAGAAGTVTVKVALTSKAAKSLKRHHKLTVAISVRFTPTGGTSRTVNKSVTFTRKPGR